MSIYILGIETSCDETSAAVIRDGREVLSNVIYSQIDIHKAYGGVVPEIASRNHLEKIGAIVDEAIEKSGIGKEDLDAIGVTYTPGLIGALLVGVTYGKGLAYALGIPLIPVHHLRGHLYGTFLEEEAPSFPALCMIVSGGHTTLALWKSHEEMEILGQTLDDAAGEAFDKVARALGLSYPGGPEIEKLSHEGNEKAFPFPIANTGKDSLDFSFSGLKSNVLNTLNKMKMKGEEVPVADVAASFQKALIDAIGERIRKALELYEVKSLVLAGGVVANRTLTRAVEGIGEEYHLPVYYPKGEFCTDNGAMIGAAAYYLFKMGKKAGFNLKAVPWTELA